MSATITNQVPPLISLLMSRSGGLRSYIASRIPSRLRRTVSADDILQDVFITVVRDGADLSAGGSDDFDAWLTRVAQRRIADAIRRASAKRRGGNHVTIYSRRKSASLVELFERVCGAHETPSRVMSTKEAVSAAQLALAALPEDYRTAITLRYIHGSSYDQMADTMSKSRTVVTGLVHRGMRMLRGIMAPLSQFQSGDRPVTATDGRS